MSLPVPLDELRRAIEQRGGAAYLLTVSDDGRPHAVHVPVAWEGEALVASVGKRTAANVAARPMVSLLCPLQTAGDYSLIVDGAAVVGEGGDERRVIVTPTKAVLHRSAAVPDPSSSCAADCVPILSEPKRA